MSTILFVYTPNAFCEFLLPAINNADTEIILKRQIFAFHENIALRLENINGEWFLKSESEQKALRDGDILTIDLEQGTKASLIVRKTEHYFSTFRKYDISGIDKVSVGNESGNHIVYQNLSLVSKEHAALQRTEQGYCIIDTSSNGTFVNGKRIKGTYELQFGDAINIFGLKIVYLGNLLAIYALEENTCIISGLPVYEDKENTKKEPEKAAGNEGRILFHRSPRNYVKPEKDFIEIEAPPNPKEESKKPIWMTIGPSFTMMIPMLIGSIMAILNANSSGSNAGMYMYTGIITAVGSALIGTFWALTNIRYSKKETDSGERKRFSAYSDYLIKRTEYIREKYEKSRKLLADTYPSAEHVLTYDEKNSELWNRNNKHEDFLSQRLGIGNLPFQMEISVPKERFTLIEDELSQRPQMIKEEYSMLFDVPVNVDLLAHKLIGVVGGYKKRGAYEIIRSLCAQLAANNCYTDVKMIFIYNKNRDEENWEYARWLPHVWAEDKKTRFVASDKTEASDVLFELTQVLRMRAEDDQERKRVFPKPYYVLIVSDMELLEGELISKYIYECDPKYGLTTLILAESRDQLPNECEYLIQKDEMFSGICDLTREYSLPVSFDAVANEQLELFARRLLSIEVQEIEKGRDIPNALSFFEMQNVQTLEELNIEERWRKNRTYDNMRALIGVKAGAEPCYLDVHEKYHGPHGLVAGTTGSGKSETLQTYMLSLAINYSPEDIGYFIIDYKGGGMAGLFEGLPHMIGAISNLSGSQVRRAMVSIKSENRRRQRIFSESNVNNINLYTKLYKNGEVSIPVPHMFIIIDEFAELKKEEPEFMKEIISVAQVGRSLGVHLILATQKPSGTVDENIWSNAKFHLCLRVQDRQDSNDVLHKADAAYITQAGRGYLQVGNDEVYELFQSGYSGAVYDENAGSIKTEIASMLSLPGKAALVGNSIKSRQQEERKNKWIQQLIALIKDAASLDGETIPAYAVNEKRIPGFYEQIQKKEIDYPSTEYNERRVEDFIQVYAAVYDEEEELTPEQEAQKVIAYAESQKKKLPEIKQRTQLDAIIEYIGRVAQKEGYMQQMQLWLPPLPETMFLQELSGISAYTGKESWLQEHSKWNLSVIMGLCDDPVNQAQIPLIVNFSENGHLAVCGTIVSGKSCFLQTLIYSLIIKYSPNWVNIYAIDFSSRMLPCFAQAPHVGDVMYEDDTEKIEKFFYMIEGVIEERKKLFSGGNYAQYVQVNGVVIPAIFVAIDNFGAFREKTENRYDDRLLRLAKEGISYGIFLAVTAAGFSTSEISSKVGENIKTVICLQLNDKFAYADALRSNQIEVLPESNIKGRGLVSVGEHILEFQTALALEAENDFGRMEEIKTVCGKMRENWEGAKAKPVPIIPEKPIWAEFETLDAVQEMQKDSRYLPIGYDMSSADVYGIDLSRIYSYLVSGRTRTGKTNLLKAIIRTASQKQGKVVVIEHGGDELKAISGVAGAEYINSQGQQAEFVKGLVEPFKKRNLKKRELIEAGKEEDEIFESMQTEPPYFIVVSDIVSFIQSIVKPEAGELNIQAFMENITERGRLHNVFFFLGVNPDTVNSVAGTNLYRNLTNFRTGIHFGGAVNNIRYFDFSQMSYTEQGKVQKVGIGLLPAQNAGVCDKVVIPLVRG